MPLLNPGISSAFVLLFLLFLSGCSTDYRALDEEQLRRQFHLDYVWETVGLHVCELRPGQSAVITTFGILDPHGKRLYAWIGFSG